MLVWLLQHQASEDRKISRHLTFTNTTETETNTQDFKFRCFECSIAVVSLIKEIYQDK